MCFLHFEQALTFEEGKTPILFNRKALSDPDSRALVARSLSPQTLLVSFASLHGRTHLRAISGSVSALRQADLSLITYLSMAFSA